MKDTIRFIVIVSSVVLVVIAAQALAIYVISIQQTKSYLESVNNRVKEDISYENNNWNTTRYNADPQLPETFPLYILSSDGYVIDRWKPVHGFLDTSDVEKLLSYRISQTVNTDTNDTWRIMSQTISEQGRRLGVITVAKHDPASQQNTQTDAQLTAIVSQIRSKLTITDSTISTVGVDVRDIPYDASFQIVDNYNHIIVNNNNTNSINRIPNYLDTSYVGNIINGPKVRQIKDTQTGQPYLIVTTLIQDKNKYTVGVIVAGREINSIFSIIKNVFLVELVGGLGIVLLLAVSRSRLRSFAFITPPERIKTIRFDKKQGIIFLDQHEIVIPYATNQFYLVEALFAHPKRRWELDELLKRFGEEDGKNWRRVYDTMMVINKKTAPFLSERLISNKDKAYFINPIFVSKIIS